MEEEKRKAYSEVVEVLKLIEDEQRIEKIPFEVIQLIKANSDPTYKPEIKKEIPLENQNLRDETYSILAWIASKYWDEDIEVSTATDNTKITINNEEEKANNIENIVENDFENQELAENSQENSKENNAENSQENIAENSQENSEEKISVYNDIEPECLERSKLPIVASNLKWYERIKNQVIRLFKYLFRIKNKEEELSRD